MSQCQLANDVVVLQTGARPLGALPSSPSVVCGAEASTPWLFSLTSAECRERVEHSRGRAAAAGNGATGWLAGQAAWD